MRKISKFLSLSGEQKTLFFEAFCWLVLAKIILIILPFKNILPLMRQKNVQHTGRTNLSTIKTALDQAASATPWNSTCLLKSMAARWMLKRLKIASHLAIGMQKDQEGKLLMHAFITAQSMDIVSKDVNFFEIYVFE